MEEVARRLEKIKAAGRWPRTPVGLNLGKNKDTPLAEAGRDYVACFRRTRDLADYFVVNVSSPNTPGPARAPGRRVPRFHPRPAARRGSRRATRPLLIKIAPDLDEAHLADVVNAVEKYRLAGIVATNTTIDKRGLSVQEEGGASGRPLTARSTEIIRTVHRLTGGRVPIIGVGGIFNAADAREKLEAGASLLQLYTGFVYEGPLVARRICEGLCAQWSTPASSRWRWLLRRLPLLAWARWAGSADRRQDAVERLGIPLDDIRHLHAGLDVGESCPTAVHRDRGHARRSCKSCCDLATHVFRTPWCLSAALTDSTMIRYRAGARRCLFAAIAGVEASRSDRQNAQAKR